MSNFARQIINYFDLNQSSNATGRFSSWSDIEKIQGSLQKAHARMEAAEKIATESDFLAQAAADFMFGQDSSLKYPGGVADSPEKAEKCKRDIVNYLKFIQYCLVSGGTRLLEELGIAGIREIYRSLNIPTSSLSSLVSAMIFIRDRSGFTDRLSPEAKTEVNELLDYIIESFS